ncbi:hypothetical protein Prudu_442S001100, partial [Prunus dulcis]
SAAKGVRRHGVDPNRSRNEEDMLSLSLPVSSFSLLPQQPSATFLLPDVAPAASLGADLRDRCQTNQHTTADISLPHLAAAWSESAGICHGSRRFVRMPPELPVRISPSFLHQIFRVRHQVQSRRKDEGRKVHRIHHRATLNLHASKSGEILGLVKIQGRLCRIFGRSLREI